MDAQVKDLFDSIVDGDAKRAGELTSSALGRGLEPEAILREGLVSAMTEVGRRFEGGGVVCSRDANCGAGDADSSCRAETPVG